MPREIEAAPSERQYPYRARIVVDVTFWAGENATAYSKQVAIANALERGARNAEGVDIESVEVPVSERRLYAEREF